MIQGTTPTLLFKFSVDLDLIKEWRIAFYQDEVTNFVKTQDDCLVDENKVIYIKLTQEETLSFDTQKFLRVQAKALTNDENVIPSQTITTQVNEILDKALFEVTNTTPTIIDTSAIEFVFDETRCEYGLDFKDLYIEQVGTGGGGTNGKDGVGIQSVEQTTTSTEDNGKNIITVTLTDGKKSTFVVENGSQGSKGDKGDKGERGEQGIQGLQGEQGKQGIQGDKGADGYTPVKGTDYFTEADKQEIVQRTIDSLPIEQSVNDSENPVSSKAVKEEFSKFDTNYKQIVGDITAKMEKATSENILNWNTLTLGYVSNASGNPSSSSSLAYTERIPVKNGDVIRCYTKSLEPRAMKFIAAYGVNGNIMPYHGGTEIVEYTVPSDTVKEIIITVYTAYKMQMITKNLVPTEYSEYTEGSHYVATPDFVGIASQNKFGLVKVWSEVVDGENVLHISTEG